MCAHSCLFKGVFKQLNAMNGTDTENQLLVSAEDVLEQESFIGYLDQRADSFYAGAMQDDMHKPSSMPLMVAVAIIASPPSGGACPSSAATTPLPPGSPPFCAVALRRSRQWTRPSTARRAATD